MRRKIIFLALIVLYAAARLALSGPALANPRALDDTTAYLRISNQPLPDVDFWGSSRPFVFPLLLKIAHQDFPTAAFLQLGFSIFAWTLLALSLAASFRTSILSQISMILILALSLARPLAGWDFTMLTESLAVSWFALFLAAALWLLRGWKTERVIALLLAGFFLAFTRDTNAYLLLMLAGLLSLAVILRWTQPRTLILAAAFLSIFLLNNADSNLGGRWIFPLFNLIGRRVLPNDQTIKFFETHCAMPVTPELLALKGEFANGQERAFYDDPALADFRAWLGQQGKSCYMRWLVTQPLQSAGEAFREFGALIAFPNVGNYFSHDYTPSLPAPLDRILYPNQLILWMWSFVSLAALSAVMFRAWRANPLWGAFILLVLPIFPHLFVTWHGDAMAPARHALSVGLELYLSLWILIFLLAEQVIRSAKKYFALPEKKPLT